MPREDSGYPDPGIRWISSIFFRTMTLEACVSPVCLRCAQLVTAAQRIAWENPMVTAHMIDANLYPSLVQKVQIQRVPLLIVDHEETASGSKTLAELTALFTDMK